MRYVIVNNFLKGLYESRGDEDRFPEFSLTKLLNVDISTTGRMIRRSGYKSWSGVGNLFEIGSEMPYQGFYQFIDVSGKKFIVIIANGYIYFEDSDNPSDWYCINVNQRLLTRERVETTYYLNLLFFNDKGNTVYLYNSNYVDGRKADAVSTIETQIIFKENEIIKYNSDFSDYDMSSANPIVIEYNGENGGGLIYQSMVGYPFKDTLHLGFFLKDESFYYVLDNGLNVSNHGQKLGILKFDTDLKVRDYILLEYESNLDRVSNFVLESPYIYIKYKDHSYSKINIVDMSEDIVEQGDISSLETPTNSDGYKDHTIGIDNNGNLYFYTDKLPNKTDWYQPILLDGWLKNTNRGAVLFDRMKNPYGINNDFYIGWHNDGIDWLVFKYKPVKKNRKIDRQIWAKDIFSNDISNLYFWVEKLVNENWAASYGLWIANGMDGLLKAPKTGLANDTDNLSHIIRRPYAPIIAPKLTNPKYSNENWTNALNYNAIQFNWDAISYPAFSHVPGENRGKQNQMICDPEFLYSADFGYEDNRLKANRSVRLYTRIVSVSENDMRYERDDTRAFYLYGELFNDHFFDNRQESKYVLLVKVDNSNNRIVSKIVRTIKDRNGETLNGELPEYEYRFILPLVKKSNLDSLLPIQVKDNYLYFGTEQQAVKKYFKYNILENEYEIFLSNDIYQLLYVSRANDTLFFIQRAYELYINEIDSQRKNVLDSSIIDKRCAFGSFLDTQIQEISSENIIQELKELGTPKIPYLTIENASTSNFTIGKKLEYFISYEFYDGSITALSLASYQYLITDANIQIRLKNINLINAIGIRTFKTETIRYINVYRRDYIPNGYEPDGITIHYDTTPICWIGRLEKDSNEDWVQPGNSNIEEYLDTLDTLNSDNIFNDNNILKYKVNDINIHKNRLILAVDNGLMYSDIDMAEAVVPENFRSVEIGDGDKVFAGISVLDYYYIFKENKIYAILGDVYNGQLLDIQKNIGCKYKYLIQELSNKIFFLNDYSIFMLDKLTIKDLGVIKLKNYFDRNNEYSIMFDYLEENAFSFVDKQLREIHWVLPVNGLDQRFDENGNFIVKNNIDIIYNIDYNYFRIREYYHNFYDGKQILDFDNKIKILLVTYEGKIKELSRDKNDDGHPIRWLIRTKYFNMTTNIFDKLFKFIKISGEFFETLRITYWIDDIRYNGEIINKKDRFNKERIMSKIWTNGGGKEISIEIAGENINNPPAAIEEISIWYELSKRL